MSDAAEVKAEEGDLKAEVKSEDVLPGDENLKETTREILKAADLESVTKKTVRRSLEAKLGQWHAHAAPLVSSSMLHMIVATPAGGSGTNHTKANWGLRFKTRALHCFGLHGIGEQSWRLLTAKCMPAGALFGGKPHK